MKLQQLGVIFVIIILPIVMVVSQYTKTLVEVANTQANYDAALMNSTYDAVRAYQINTLNNSYAAVNQSKVRDVRASVNAFFYSLALGLQETGYTKEDLKEFVPAILFTSYDGYYIYTPYQNVATVNGNNAEFSRKGTITDSAEFDLKPYSYYSCQYTGSDYNLTVCYTLDNYISVMGTYDGKYITGAGYYINTSAGHINCSGVGSDDKDISLGSKYVTINDNGNQVTIGPETLGEYISVVDSVKNVARTIREKAKDAQYYNYIVYNQVKYYWDTDPNKDASSYQNVNVFYLDNNVRTYIGPNMYKTLATYVGGPDAEKWIKNNQFLNLEHYKDVNNYYYYKHAIEFSNQVSPALKKIDLSGIFDGEGKVKENATGISEFFTRNYQVNQSDDKDGTASEENVSHVITDYDNKQIFSCDNVNDPELDSSSFNQHRIDVIIKSIEANLVTTIGGFNSYFSSSYQYDMPILSEVDWDKIANNVTCVTFMQGITIGNFKYYNNYSACANTKNKDFVSKNSIYVQNNVVNGQEPTYYANYYANCPNTYHNPGCTTYNSDTINNGVGVIGYKNIDYELQTYVNSYADPSNISKSSEEPKNYVLHPESQDYNCVVSLNGNEITPDDLIGLKSNKTVTNTKTGESNTYNISKEVERAYVSALAREKGASYKSLSTLNYVN